MSYFKYRERVTTVTALYKLQRGVWNSLNIKHRTIVSTAYVCQITQVTGRFIFNLVNINRSIPGDYK